MARKLSGIQFFFQNKGTKLSLITSIQNFHLQPICLEQSGELGSIYNGIQKNDQFYIHLGAKNYFEIMRLYLGYFGSSYRNYALLNSSQFAVNLILGQEGVAIQMFCQTDKHIADIKTLQHYRKSGLGGRQVPRLTCFQEQVGWGPRLGGG